MKTFYSLNILSKQQKLELQINELQNDILEKNLTKTVNLKLKKLSKKLCHSSMRGRDGAEWGSEKRAN